MGRGRQATVITKQQEQDFIELYNQGISLEMIGRKIGLTGWTIQKFAVKLKAEGKIVARGNVKCQWNKAKDSKLLELKEAGHSWSEISDIMGMGRSTVQTRYHRCLKPEIEQKIKKRSEPKKLWEIEAEARKRGMSYGQYVGGGADSRV